MEVDYETIKRIEAKWRKRWEKNHIFEADVDPTKPKFFITFPYPYVNGGPHLGHMFSAFRVDSYARFKRMQGYNVLYPQGFHATGEPIVGAVERLKEGDESQIEAFKLYGATDEELREFVERGPEFVARYWMKRWIEDLKLAGLSIDWRRTFVTAITPQYSRFIEWQYEKLREKGFVGQGTHPVIWCPRCKSPTGDHDRLVGEGETIVEFHLLKFRLVGEEAFLPCGTLRPETIFGVTNLWINPEGMYVLVEVDGERWIVSKETIAKLEDQLHSVSVLREMGAEELIGKYVESPLTNARVPILPAQFVKTDSVTGVVMSVPSHAPYDWVALRELKERKDVQQRFGIEEIVSSLGPISIIEVKGYGEHPAKDEVEKLGISSQVENEKLDEATETLYKKEFYHGKMRGNCGKYAGKLVRDVKREILEELRSKGALATLYEPTGTVICRCRTRCHVKILENQWFLKFSLPEWKERVRRCVERMKFYPEEIKQQFLNTIDWLEDKACTRRTGLGTRLPWDKEWIVETLSDSTIYMAYYTIARIINEKNVDADKLTDAVFDYVFFGKGDPREISEESGLDLETLEGMRREFEYFYPVDLRGSGKDLVQNHLTFYLFHHVAIWDEKYWPKAIAVNGFVKIEGEKMSKRLGNVIPFRDALEKYGSDLVRINLISSAEGLEDADWREARLDSFLKRINTLFWLAGSIRHAGRTKRNMLDAYLEAKLQEMIKECENAYENLKFRTATQLVMFDLMNEIEEYIRRNGGIENCNKETIAYVFSTIVKLLTPLLPHVCEELWHRIGGDGFVALQEFPKVMAEKLDEKIIALEKAFRLLLEDVKSVMKFSPAAKTLYVYCVTEEEKKYVMENSDYIKEVLGKDVVVYRVGEEGIYDPKGKASRAKEFKPGIYLE